MKKLFAVIMIGAAAFAGRAQTLFSDSLTYPNGPVAGDGEWYAFNTNTTLAVDCFLTNDLIILNSANAEAVAVPFTNTASTTTYCSFTIKVTSLPTTTGGYFFTFADTNNATSGRVFIDTKGTQVPGTYRLGVANYATSISTVGSSNFVQDLATGITYTVVASYDSILGGTLQINPSSASDGFLFPSDQLASGSTAAGGASQVVFSQYSNQGIAEIGNVVVGVGFSDVDPSPAPVASPVIGVQPQTNSVYLNNSVTLYTAASGVDQTYLWYSNSVALSDGANVFGSASNILVLSNLQTTATYTVEITDGGGTTTSSNAVVTVITTPTKPFFTSQPFGLTNSTGASVTLSGPANGTGPISYQWYYAPSNTITFSLLTGAASSSYTVSSATLATSGSYYVVATNVDGMTTSSVATVLITPPPLVTIASVHNYLIVTNNNNFTLQGNRIFNVIGTVTSIGNIESKTACEYFIQDTNATPGTGGALVYIGSGAVASNAPPVGSLVSIIGTVNEYYGELEVDPNLASGANIVTVLSLGSTNNQTLPAPAVITPAQFGQWATNTMGSYGIAAQCSLLTMTNVWLYSNTNGGALTGNYPTNGTKTMYAFRQPFATTNPQPNIEVFAYTYTNAVNQLGTNFWGQPVPSFAYEITGIMGLYNTNTPNLIPTRYADIVTAQPAAFTNTLAITSSVPTITWPAVAGQTYSVYTATNLAGPWTQKFGLGYYPSVGTYTDTNAAPAKFYRVSTP